MRVIAGEWKGLQLKPPAGQVARPTTDRVKESMFNLLGFDWSGGVAVDLFAGSGALGLEALSRGADGVVFAEVHPTSYSALRENIARCRAEERTTVVRKDWALAWERVTRDGVNVGWVFVDPPYAKNLWDSVLEKVCMGTVTPRFGVVCEHPKSVILREQIGDFLVWKSKTYGDISITIYRPSGANH